MLKTETPADAAAPSSTTSLPSLVPPLTTPPSKFHNVRSNVSQHTKTASSSLSLSPFDVLNRGRAIPMLYFYPTQFDEERLIRSLQCALDKYRVLDGRYSDIRTCVISDEVGGVSLEIVRGTFSYAKSELEGVGVV